MPARASPRLAVLGRDVSRSLSPRIHAAAIEALGLELEYTAISCPTREDFHQVIDARALRGANVTIPYKAEAYARATIRTPAAIEIGAVNTLTFDGETIEGDNTDGPGLEAVLLALPASSLERVQLLGDGGAAKAARWALARAGAKEVIGSARRTGTLGPVEGATLILSTLPSDPELRFERFVDLARRPFILDAAYAIDGETPLVALARAHGLDAQDGRAMLAEQGARSLRRWTGGDLSLIRAAMFAVLYSGNGAD